MELAETINSLNEQLVNLFGTTLEGKPIWRIVWSEDQFERRLMDVTDKGIALAVPEIRTVPKYRQWIRERYVLERLVVVPEMNQKEIGVKQSYEPIYPFENAHTGEYLPPRIDAAKFVIDAIYAAQGKKSMRKYVDDLEKDPQGATEARINKLQADLFGEDTVGPLEHGGGVYVKANDAMVVNDPEEKK